MKKEDPAFPILTVYGVTAPDCRRMGIRLCTKFSEVAALDLAPKADNTHRALDYGFSQRFALHIAPHEDAVSDIFGRVSLYLESTKSGKHSLGLGRPPVPRPVVPDKRAVSDIFAWARFYLKGTKAGKNGLGMGQSPEPETSVPSHYRLSLFVDPRAQMSLNARRR